jgi:hypothetical protein
MADDALDDSPIRDTPKVSARNTVDVYVPHVRQSSPRSACEMWLKRRLCNAGEAGFEHVFLQRVMPPRLL